MNGFSHPKGYYPLFGAFMLERAGYYGVRALLMVFMIKVLSLDPERTSNIHNWFVMSIYFTPFLFGYLADSVVGIKRSAILSCAVLALSAIMMSLSSVSMQPVLLYIGLAMMVIAQGFFRPSLYTMLGGLYKEKNDSRRDSGFTLILIAVNVGAFAAPAICGYLGERVSWSAGFLMAGLFCLSALPLVRKVKDFSYPKKSGLTAKEEKGLLAILVIGLFALLAWSMVSSYADFISFIFVNSAGSNIERFQFWLPVSAILSGLLLAPLFAWLWVWLDNKGKGVNTFVKFIAGFVTASVGFLLFYLVLLLYQRTGSMNIWLLVLATVVSSAAEFFIAPIALSCVTKLSPAKISAFVIGTWLMLAYPVRKLVIILMPDYGNMSEFWLFAIPILLCLLCVSALFFAGKPIRRWMGNVQ